MYVMSCWVVGGRVVGGGRLYEVVIGTCMRCRADNLYRCLLYVINSRRAYSSYHIIIY